jgi:hypothetical protein
LTIYKKVPDAGQNKKGNVSEVKRIHMLLSDTGAGHLPLSNALKVHSKV